MLAIGIHQTSVFMSLGDMPIQRSLARKWTHIAFRTPVLYYLVFVCLYTLKKQVAKLPDCKGMHEADQKTGGRQFDV